MIKLIGCVLIISACTQMGCAMATDKIRQMKYLKLLRRLIFETRAMVEGGMTFGEIILKLSLQKDYSDFTFLSQDTSSPDVRRRITEDIYNSKLFDNEIRQTAIDFFEKLRRNSFFSNSIFPLSRKTFLCAYVVLLISDIFLVNIISEPIRFISLNLQHHYEDIISLPQTTQMAVDCILIFSNSQSGFFFVCACYYG